MAHVKTIALGGALALASAWLILTSVWSSGGLTGRVSDAASGAPIADAVVVGSWQRVRAINSAPIDYLEVQATHTDSQGVFRLLPWGPRVRLIGSMATDQPVLRIFHRSYEPLVVNRQSMQFADAHDALLDFKMDASSPSTSDVERLTNFAWHIALSFFDANAACPWGSVGAMWRALKDREAELVAAGTQPFLPPPFSTPASGNCP